MNSRRLPTSIFAQDPELVKAYEQLVQGHNLLYDDVLAIMTTPDVILDSNTYRLTMRPSLVAGRIGTLAKPTPVEVGCHAGYSMPIWASDDEELFFREYVAGRWDGATNITCSVICCLASAETAGEDFRFELAYQAIKLDGTEVLTTSVTTVEVEQNCAAAAQYQTFKLDFALTASGIEYSDHLGLRLRRIAVEEVGANECEGEVIVLDCIITYTVDKIYKTT